MHHPMIASSLVTSEPQQIYSQYGYLSLSPWIHIQGKESQVQVLPFF